MEAKGGHKDAAHIHALIIEYLEWAGLQDLSGKLRGECEQRGWAVSRETEGGSSSSSSRATSRLDTAEESAVGVAAGESVEEILTYFDTGQGAKFFQNWKAVQERGRGGGSLEVLTLEFYLHVYFATLPLRHGHKEDHPAAMAVFRRFLETCPARVGTVQDLLPFYALPYVPDPTLHPAFAPVFQDWWVRELRGRLCTFLGRRPPSSRPSIFSYIHHHRHHASSVGAALVAQESAASAVRSQRTLRRRLQRLQDDYHKLIGVAWELTQGLEAAVRGEKVDLEGTLAACTHRYPELFTLTLTADTKAQPATILLASMERCRKRPQGSGTSSLPALDFGRVRTDLGTAPETHILLLLQALRQRITKVTSGGVRQAVVTAYVRGDVLGLRGSCRSWSRMAAALSSPQPPVLAQAAARLVNALTAFTAGRTYLASNEVCEVLLAALKAENVDPVTSDMALAALQKLSIRGEVQAALIEGGAVEWLIRTLSQPQPLTPYTQEYSCALLMNLTLRSAGRARCLSMGPSLLTGLTNLITTVPSHVVPYVTGILYSLLSHPSLRQDAFDIHLDATLEKLAQCCSADQRRQLEYIVEQVRRDPPLSPPPSPDPVVDMEEDPEWLEEELELDDPVKAPPHAPSGEHLLSWRYTLHPGEAEEEDRTREMAPIRSAPAQNPWEPKLESSLPRPNSDGFVMRHHAKQQSQQYASTPRHRPQPPSGGGQWDYPSDSDPPRSTLNTERSRSSEAEGGDGGGAWCGGKEMEEWAHTLRRSPPTTAVHRKDTRGHLYVSTPATESEEVIGGGVRSEVTPRPSVTCPAEAMVSYMTRGPQEPHPQGPVCCS